ncbi:MAG: HK97 gp10 family phage protein [Armatimonadota bacterium]
MAIVRILRDNRAAVRGLVQAAMNASLQEAATVISDQARARVPVDTGALLASIRVQPTGVLRYAVVADKEYAGIIETGSASGNRPPQPYLIPSALLVFSLLPSIARRNLASRLR